MDSIERLVGLLVKALHEPLARKQTIAEFQCLVWEGLEPTVAQNVREVFGDLAYDLDYFEEKPLLRKEDCTFFGHKRVEAEIRDALRKLRQAGVSVPEEG